ncbi:MAG: divergent polysaccharide deacetylase family protein [Epsilonproteobacteria bacterium]|nr:divergent polysaccharide deacetylase family protein [Campylobacterota bacterium]
MTKSKKTKKRRKTSRSKKRGSIALTILLTLLAIVLTVMVAGIAGWYGFESGKTAGREACEKELSGYRKDLKALRHKIEVLQKREKPGKTEKKKERKKKPVPSRKKPAHPAMPFSEAKDFVAAGGKGAETSRRSPARSGGHRPKLVIIIDDVAYPSQLKAIRRLPWHITPSLFPPTVGHPDTPKLAEKLHHYMIHLPMEAQRFNRPEPDTLTVQTGEKKISARLGQIRRLFPDARFINNHTGSRFTADAAAMARFCRAAKRDGFLFVDSRTTPRSAVAEACRRYGLPYFSRDIFLDNKPDIAYIRGQLEKAVRIARRHGYAIAIGHPHRKTFEALAGAGSLLKGIDVVYMDELYEKIR